MSKPLTDAQAIQEIQDILDRIDNDNGNGNGNGSSGTSGIDGTSGVDGNDGSSGTSGSSGSSGVDGNDGSNGNVVTTKQDNTNVVKFDGNYQKFTISDPFISTSNNELEIDLSDALLGSCTQLYTKGSPLPFKDISFVNYQNIDNYDESKVNLIILDYKSNVDVTAVIINDNVLDLPELLRQLDINLDDILNSRMSNLKDNLNEEEKQLIRSKLGISNNSINNGKQKKVVDETSYTLIDEDSDYILEFTHKDGCTVNLPSKLKQNKRFEGKQLGDGNVLIKEGKNVTLLTPTSEDAMTSEKNSVFAIDHIRDEVYLMYGRLHKKGNDSPSINKEIVIINKTEYTLKNSDKNKRLNFTHKDGCVVTIPKGLDNGNRYEGKQMGAGNVSFVGDINIHTVNSQSPKTNGKYSVWALDCENMDEYVLFGNLEKS